MAGNPPEGLGDDFFEQILAVPPSYSAGDGGGESAGGGYGGEVGSMPMALQLGSAGSSGGGAGYRGGGGVGMGLGMPLGLNLEQRGFLGQDNRFRDEVVEANNTNNTNTSNVSASINDFGFACHFPGK